MSKPTPPQYLYVNPDLCEYVKHNVQSLEMFSTSIKDRNERQFQVKKDTELLHKNYNDRIKQFEYEINTMSDKVAGEMMELIMPKCECVKSIMEAGFIYFCLIFPFLLAYMMFMLGVVIFGYLLCVIPCYVCYLKSKKREECDEYIREEGRLPIIPTLNLEQELINLKMRIVVKGLYLIEMCDVPKEFDILVIRGLKGGKAFLSSHTFRMKNNDVLLEEFKTEDGQVMFAIWNSSIETDYTKSIMTDLRARANEFQRVEDMENRLANQRAMDESLSVLIGR